MTCSLGQPAIKMTPKQVERIQKKISDIKRRLAAEKQKFGCYDDSRGLRYVPPRYFIQLDDYLGAQKYLKWFDKNFPDDGGFPEFLFERAIIAFKIGKIQDAERYIFETFRSNPYWIDKFLGNPIIPIDMWHGSNIQMPEYTDLLFYASNQPEWKEFTTWLTTFIATEAFILQSSKYMEVPKLKK